MQHASRSIAAQVTGSAYHAMTFYFINGASAIRVGGPEEGKGAISARSGGWRMTGSASHAMTLYYCLERQR